MPNWSDVLREIQACEGGLDRIRRKYLKKVSEITGRPVIAYYSGWLQKPNQYSTSLSDDDKNGFMNAVHGLPRDKGLDLILHTPGGDFAATESIVDYLRKMFGTDIRAIVPQLAMSGGTMIACACREIWMGKQSNLGPIDPQFRGIPAHGVIAEFEEAVREIRKDPGTIPLWQTIIGKYHPTFIGECRNAIHLATEIVTGWLVSGMFAGEEKAREKAAQIVLKLNNHADTKTHARHIHADEAQRFGLKILMLEDAPEMQDAVLTTHHAYMHTFAGSGAAKIIENHLGNAIVFNVRQGG
jgi:hypothetical protein